jgi:hypothetical protein
MISLDMEKSKTISDNSVIIITVLGSDRFVYEERD